MERFQSEWYLRCTTLPIDVIRIIVEYWNINKTTIRVEFVVRYKIWWLSSKFRRRRRRKAIVRYCLLLHSYIKAILWWTYCVSKYCSLILTKLHFAEQLYLTPDGPGWQTSSLNGQFSPKCHPSFHFEFDMLPRNSKRCGTKLWERKTPPWRTFYLLAPVRVTRVLCSFHLAPALSKVICVKW